jgi:hypothetical protein
MQNLCFGPECTISGYRSCEAFILLPWIENDVWDYFGVFSKPSARKKMKTCVLGLNAQFQGTEVLKHSFYSIGHKMMFGSVSAHIANLQHVKRCKTCVSGMNTLFCHTDVVKHPNYSIGSKMMFGSVS